MGQAQSTQQLQSYSSIKVKKNPKMERIEHEGILKCSPTPFKNSKPIDLNGVPYFIENARLNLAQLIKSRKRLNKKFSSEQIIKITQDLLYTLAFYESIGKPYPYLSADHAYFVDGSLKLIPGSIIQEDIYELAKMSLKQRRYEYLPLSPEMLIGLKYQEPGIEEEELLAKSNIFSLGILMSEVCTLKTPSQCYDFQTCSILSSKISSRIEEIEGEYGKMIAGIIANMLDYDFEERMSPKDFAIWINRQLREEKKVQIEDEEQKEQKLVESHLEKEQEEKQKIIQSQIKCSEIKQKIQIQKEKTPSNKFYLKKVKSKLNTQIIPNPYLKENNFQPTKHIEQVTKFDYLKKSPSKSSIKYNYPPAYQEPPQRQFYQQEKSYSRNYDNNFRKEERYNLAEISPQRKNYAQSPEVKKHYEENIQTESPINIYKNGLMLEQTDMNYLRGKQTRMHEDVKNPYYQQKVEKTWEDKENSSMKKIRSEIQKSKKILEQFRKQQGSMKLQYQ